MVPVSFELEYATMNLVLHSWLLDLNNKYYIPHYIAIESWSRKVTLMKIQNRNGSGYFNNHDEKDFWGHTWLSKMESGG